MAIVSVVVAITVVIANMISEETVKFIGQWLMENMVKPVGQLLSEKLVKPIGQWLGYLFYYSSNIENMKEQLKKLRDFRERVPLPHSVDAATRNIVEIETDVNKWKENADLIMREAKQVIEDEEKSKMRCSYAICLNLKQRHQQSKKAKKIVQDINEVLKNWRTDKVYMNFGSRMVTAKELMVALGDANFNMIGVWGMPGVGKTTLVREVAKQVKEEKLFDEVAIAAVTQSPNLKEIQGEIAETLDLKLDKETSRGRADLLRVRLTKDKNKKILVILDDIWEKLDLDEIGIPRTGCKVVLTSRSRDVLSSEMGTQKDFGLEVLLKEEAWCLFEKLLGDSLVDSNLRSKAIEVSTACAGLPLALVTVAKALKNKCFIEWEDALRQLRRPSPRNQKRMQEVIYSAIKLSYSHLESPELKSFFLFCAQNQVYSAIHRQELLKKCFGLRLFHGIGTLEEARNRIYTLVRSLKDSGLLLDAPDTDECVSMHDLTRDVALLISYETQNVLTMRVEGLEEWPDEDDMKMCTAIFVFNKIIHELPDRLECPELRCLYVYPEDREGSFKISDTFFKGMRKLKVLDLTYMQISSLPSSLKLLTNLRTLCLDECVLGDIAMIGEMKNLEILSLIGSEFKYLPGEIGLLTHLRMLDLSDCEKLEVIPANVLSRLILLEELYVGNSFTQWEVEGLNNERASLAELKHLSRLSTLEVHIPDANMMPKDLLFVKLKGYKIFIGDVWDWSDKYENSRVLKLKLNTCFQLEGGIKMLFNGIEDLCLDELNGIKSIAYELDVKGFQQLKCLHVQNNAEIKYIIQSRGLVIDDVVFPALEIFSLKNMINLEGIYDAQLPLTSFRDIRIMKVEHCEKLKFLFSSSIAKGLSQLQELEIKECNIMRAIVVKEDGELEDRDMILFPLLRHLELQCLPKLVSFLSTLNSIRTDVGEIIHKGELDFQEIPYTGMQPLFNEEVVFPNLETLELSFIHSEEILLHNQHRASSSFKLTNPRFRNLRDLNVKGSGNLKYLLSSSTATFMIQLKYLVIEDCKVMEEVLLTEDLGEAEIISKVLFPQLELLILKDLPVLKRFCVGSNIKFPSLKDMVIEKCPKLESFIFKPVSSDMTLSKELKKVNSEEISQTAMQPLFNEEVVFPSLETLKLFSVQSKEIQLHNQDWPTSSFKSTNIQTESRFQNLRALAVKGSGNLKYLLSSSTATFMVQLKDLYIEDCKVMEEILLLTEDLGEEEIITKELFPRLENLVLKDLPVLKRFCVGRNIIFRSLTGLKIEKCPKLESFIFNPVSSKEISHATMQPLFNEEVAFPNLKLLVISHLPNLKIIWHDKFAPGSFIKLQTMKVKLCENLMKIFQVNMLSGFHSLEYLEVDGCGSLQEIFELQGQEVMETHAVTMTQLKTLFMVRLPKLKRVWNKNPQGTFSFPNLQKIVVGECESLKSLFPTSVARCLQQLNDLRIFECGIEEIIEQEEGAKEDTRFVFPKLTLLTLRNLSKLKWFYRGVHTSEWPLLETLEVFGSNEIQIFASKNYRIQEQDEQSQLETSIQQPFFLVEEVAFPSLKKLFLDQCVLEDIAMIGELRNLENLSLRDSNVQQLPRETGLLTHLRILNLRNCTKLKVIPPNVLSCLIQLEELYVDNSFTQWDIEGLNNERASLAELKHLSRLTTLEVHIPDANMLPKDLLFEKLQRYKILVGDVWDWSYCLEHSRALKLKLNSSFHLERGIKMLLNGIENLCLDELKGVKSVIYELDMTGFQQLKHFHVHNNDEIEYIINSREMVMSSVAFPVLEKLYLKNLTNLEEICHGQIPSASFCNLSIMRVEHCEKLKFIFSSTIAKGLPQLQELMIQECSIMGAIIIKEEGEIEDRDMILFPQLRHLELHQLPKLVSFLNTQKSVIIDAGEIIPECELDFHMPILQEQVVFPSLESLELSSIHSEEILLHNQHRATSSFKLTDPRFQNLHELTVKGSGNLKYLLSSSTARFMVQLKYLYIEDCKVMEEILLTEDLGEEEIIPKVLFPQLKDLFLKDLPVLKRFCIGSNIRFPSLTGMVIEKCPKLESFIFKPVSSGMTLSKELKEVNSEEISQTAMQPLFNEEVAFPNLESLLISHMPNLEIIWHDKFAPGSYTKLQSMNVQSCESLMNIFQVNMLSRFQSLESLGVEDCGSLQEIFELEGQEVTETRAVTVTQLKKLGLHRLPKLKRVWNKDPQETFSFPNLQQISVWECESLKSLFPTSVARCLQQLDDLRIVECGIEEIIEQEEGAKEDARFVFPKLTLLILQNLSKLKWFYRGVHTSEWPLLKTLVVNGSNEIQIFVSKNYRIEDLDEQNQLATSIQQPLFLVEEVAFPSLEILTIIQMENLKLIWHDQLAEDSFFKLQSLFVLYCESLVNIFESNMLTRFQSLERLEVCYCGSLQEVFELQRHDVRESHAVTAIPLKRLILCCLPKMKQVWNKDPQGIFSFQNLQFVNVWECESLKILFPASVAICLMQLEDLRIADCGVEEIVAREDVAEATARLVFPKATFLVLHNLRKLKWFCRGVHTSEWPLLKELDVSGCVQIEIFASKKLNFQEIVEQSQLEISIQQPLFLVEEVAFPSLETLKICHMENLKIIWHNQLANDSFFKLHSLFVEYCENLVNIFESNMLTRFQSLETLQVTYCGSLQEVFEIQGHDVRDTHAVTIIPLKKLYLRHLPKMKQIWNKDPHGIFSFPNLQVVSAWECECLQSLFPASVATSLKQLEDLRIVDSGVEEIVAREDVAEATARHLFPKVTILYLQKLPKLKWFCRGVHTSEWPLLKDLEVGGCDQIEIFTSKILYFQETVEQSQLETFIQQPLFLVEEGTLFPNLEVLRWGGNYKMKEIQRDQLFEQCLYKLKVLRVIDFVPISDWITFLKRLHNLEKLFVKSNSWEEIFPYKELFDMENHATILARLRELELFELPMLTHLWKEDTQPSPMFHNLENLKVSICDKLKNLVPSSVSFQNLTILEICKCHGLINLVTSSTAKSLVQLKKMSVSECERIIEVITREGGEASEVITFTQLTYLKLDCLPNLSSFCSRSYSFEFPSLEEVIVRQCPEMKTFSHGALGTPKLGRVQATQEDEWHWKANLNTTIHWLWESKYNTTTQ